MLHIATLSGLALAVIGLVLVGLSQRVSDEVGSFYTVMLRRVLNLRGRWPLLRSRRRLSLPNDQHMTASFTRDDASVEYVIAQLEQGTLPDALRLRLAAALHSPAMSIPSAVTPQEADVNEALTLATVASSAVKRVGQRSVLALRFTGIVTLLLGIGVTALSMWAR